MQIALFGYGKMGTLIAEEAKRQGDTIVSIHTSSSTPILSNADVAIDFSIGSAVKENVAKCLTAKIPLVIGTTGWENDLAEVKKMVQEKQGSVLYGSNFSIGITALLIALKQACEFLTDTPFSCGILDLHHKDKRDAPSGTALTLQGAIEKHLKKPAPIASQRVGSYPGKHTIHFSSNDETLSFTHDSLSRECFARGALKASRWIVNKTGYFTLEDYVANH